MSRDATSFGIPDVAINSIGRLHREENKFHTERKITEEGKREMKNVQIIKQ